MNRFVIAEPDKCIGCRTCEVACVLAHPTGAENDLTPENFRPRLRLVKGLKLTAPVQCRQCENAPCVNVCPTGALTLKGEVMSVNEIIQVLRRDAHYFRKSGGGVTLSGGEPLTQWRFARELLKACKAQGWDTAIETTAYGTDEAIEAVIPYVDLVLMDCKSTDPEVHKRVTGVSNEKIRKNAAKIVKMANKVIIRVPTIPTVNAFEEEFHRIAEFAKSLGVDTVHVLPYHTLGESKYEMLGKAYTMGYEIKSLPRDEAEVFRQVVLSHGLNCVVGG